MQFSCIAGGATAATGASLGKLNLSLIEVSEAGVETTQAQVDRTGHDPPPVGRK
ncbi:hypothetical protein [Sorangium sp. So ce513]|uniref:hypothetical protein n=1 Tax=Sorangium sp. So ce513 TaxID=3133315 RepID=UPI003F641EAE